MPWTSISSPEPYLRVSRRWLGEIDPGSGVAPRLVQPNSRSVGDAVASPAREVEALVLDERRALLVRGVNPVR